MSIIRLVLLAANAAQTIAWGKEVVQSEKGQKVIESAKEKGENAKNVAIGSAITASVVVGDIAKGVKDKTKPARDIIADKINKATTKVETVTKEDAKKTKEDEVVMPKAKDEW